MRDLPGGYPGESLGDPRGALDLYPWEGPSGVPLDTPQGSPMGIRRLVPGGPPGSPLRVPPCPHLGDPPGRPRV